MAFFKKNKKEDWADAMRLEVQPSKGPSQATSGVITKVKSWWKKKESGPSFSDSMPGTEWWEKQPPAHRLLRILFGIVALFATVSLALFILLPINESVRVTGGEILAQNAPMEIIAPFDGRLIHQKVLDGQRVKQGDTLLVIENELVKIAFRQSATEISIAAQGISSLEQLIINLTAQIGEQRQGKNISIVTARSERSSTDADLRGLREQVEKEEKKLSIAKDRFEKNQALFLDGVISAAELQVHYTAMLEGEKTLSALRLLFRQREIAQSNLPNLLADRGNQQDLAVLGRENERLNTQKLLTAEQLRLESLREQYRKDSIEATKQYIIAPTDGYATKIFNTRQQVSEIGKGQSLLVIVPDGHQAFSARLSVSQHQIRGVQPGSKVRLKVDAFNYLQFGVMPGEVRFVGQDTSASFYVIADLHPEQNAKISLKNGYRVQGEIVLNRVRLWRFMWNKLFRVDN